MAIRAVLFDVGGVLLRTEDLAPRRKWEQRFGLPEWGLAEIVFSNPVARRSSLGQASQVQVWAEVARRLSLNPEELEALKLDFWKGDVWDEALLDFIRSLRPRLKTGIISNAWSEAWELVKTHVNQETFDAVIFSSEEGIEKPEPEIYQRALARLNVLPAEAIFVDDMPKNVGGARAVGMWGVHFTDSLKAREEIKRLIGLE
jgi:putative hydrolase of the HAD superfamily